MATSNSKGGGFSIGMVYGLIVSIALYLVLCYIFPVNLGATTPAQTAAESVQEPAPVVAEAAPAMAADAVQPEMADVSMPAMPTMSQPEVGESATITVGGAGDTGPTTLVNPQIAGTAVETQPAVETESTGVPEIGSATPGAVVPDPAEAQAQSTSVAAEVAPEPIGAPVELARSASGPALEVFAVSFTGESDLPMLAIILEDTLETSLKPLFDTGKPFSFALSADVDSSESAQSIRESGYEVVAMIPAGTSRSEGLAENINRFMANVPVAVAMLDANAEGVMLNRDAMNVVLESTRPTGLGILTFNGAGELVARDQAHRAGALYGSALQIFDDTQDVELILQALDQAAFVAVTSGSAIVYAHTKPATIEAIVRWFDSPRAARLQIVPVSVAIQRPTN